VTAALDPARARQLIAEAREDDAAMTPAPWELGTAGDCDLVSFVGDDAIGVAGVCCANHRANGNGIARTRNNLAALADQLEAALAEVERLRAPAAAAAPRGSVGDPGVRDPDAPCSDYAPGPGAGDCGGDGHHLCRGCRHFAGAFVR
jgi:hypothetical protein